MTADHTARQGLDWGAARAATAHCLIGCSIGEVLGLVLGQSAGLTTAATIGLSVGLAFFFGFLLAAARIRRQGLAWGRAVRIAVAAEFLSITTMELVNNAIILAVPGVLAAGLADAFFWASLAVALAVAFVVTLPVNAWLISRGRGHALSDHHGRPVRAEDAPQPTAGEPTVAHAHHPQAD